MNRLLILAFVVCTIYIVQGSTDKIKREASLSSKLFQDSISNVHTRRKRSTASKSYIFFDNRSKKKVQLWYLDTSKPGNRWRKFKQLEADSTIRIDTYDTDKWTATAVKNGATFLINGNTRYTPEANTKHTRAICIITQKGQKENRKRIKANVETLVVVDKSVRDRFKSDSEVEIYVKVLLSLTTEIYQHKSLTDLGLYINIVASKIVILNYELKLDASKFGKNLHTACKVMNTLGNNGPKKFDHKLFLTRNAFGAGGYAQKGAMCSTQSSCSMVYDHGFHAAFLIAHEVGHSLGLEHGDFEQYSRYLMAGMVDGLFNSHRWSTQSQMGLLRHIRKHVCLRNKVHVEESYKNPGQYYSFEKQCDLEFEEGYTAWQPTRWEPGEPCQRLRCRMPGMWYMMSKTTGSPALDGTKCGENKWCMSGRCEDKGDQSTSVTGKYR